MEASFLDQLRQQPGDPVVRQAYAAALRPVDPPRSQLLEAEMAWSQRRTADALRAVESLARDLDPLWVARVCRPPLGICCDRVRWDHGAGDRQPLDVTVEHLRWLEARFQIHLPVDYQAFLLTCNGGCPTPASLHLSLPQMRAGCNPWFSYACSIWSAAESTIDWDLDLVWRLQQLEQDVRRRDATDQELDQLPGWERDLARRWRSPPRTGWIVIGAGAPTGELEWFCLDCAAGGTGQVYCVDALAEFPDGPDYCLVAASFREFLALLGPA